MRRIAPVTIASLCVAALLVWYVIYTQGVVRELRREDASLEEVFARLTTQEPASESKDNAEVAA